MIKFIFCSLLIPSVALAAESKPEDLAANIAESIYFSAKQSGTFGQWVKNSPLPTSVQKDIQTYLVSHHLDTAEIPALFWTPGTSKIKANKIWIDFTDVPEHQRFTADGKTFSLQGKKIFFSEVMQRIQDARRKPSQVSEWLLTFLEPASIANDTTDSLFIAMSYVNPLNWWPTCSGSESVSRAQCFLLKDSSMIKTDLGDSAKIDRFTCSHGKFNNLTYTRPETSLSNVYQVHQAIAAQYDSSGKLQSVRTENRGHSCNYIINNGKFTQVTASKDSECLGRTYIDSDDQYATHTLKSGDKIKIYGEIPIPFDRLEQCCADPNCPNEVMGKVTSNQGASPLTTDVEGMGTP